MLQTMRKGAHGVFAKILLILLVIPFALWGIGDIFRGGKEPSAATVGKSRITQSEYRTELQRMEQQLGQMGAQFMQNPMIRRQLLEQFIRRELLLQEAKAIGLQVTDKALIGAIQSNALFRDEKGQFNRDRFNEFLQESRMSEQHFLAELRKDIIAQLLVETFAMGVTAPSAITEAMLRKRLETRTVSIALLEQSANAPVEEPSNEQVEAYFKEHIAEYLVPERRTLEYIALTDAEMATALGITLDDAVLQTEYQENIGSYTVPEKRAISQLLYATEQEAKDAESQLTAGTSFTEVAESSKKLNDALTLGTIGKSQLPADAQAPVFALKEGEVSQPVKSAFGWHIYKVDAIQPAKAKPFAEVKSDLRKKTLETQLKDVLTERSAQLDDALAAGSNLAEALKQAGISGATVKTIGPVASNGQKEDGSLSPEDALTQLVITKGYTLEEGETSALALSQDGYFYVVHATKVQPEAAKPLAEVRAQVVRNWQIDHRDKKLGERATGIAAAIKEKGFEEIAKTESLRTVNNVRVAHDGGKPLAVAGVRDAIPSPGLVADIFRTAQGGATAAYEIAPNRWAIAKVESITPLAAESGEAMKAERAKIEDQLNDTLPDEVLSQYFNYLRSKTEVTVNDAALQGDSASGS